MEEHPGANIPRYLGMHAFQTGAGSGERLIGFGSQSAFAQVTQIKQQQDITLAVGATRDIRFDTLFSGATGYAVGSGNTLIMSEPKAEYTHSHTHSIHPEGGIR